MKKTAIILNILAISASVSAQTITLGAIQTIYCSGANDTLYVPYQATGSFKADNVFKIHLSDNAGSFANFRLAPSSSASLNGMLALPPNLFANGTRVLVASSDPYILSDTSKIDVDTAHQTIAIWATRSSTGREYGNSTIEGDQHGNGNNRVSACPGFAGDTLVFAPPPFDSLYETPGTSFQLTFPPNATVISSFDSTAKVVFSKPGFDSVSIAVFSPLGCSVGSSWPFYIANPHPQIPANVRVVSGDSGNVIGNNNDSAVWVKTGGSYTTTYYDGNCIIYAEPGSSIVVEPDAIGPLLLLYLRPGSAYVGGYDPLPQMYVFGPHGVDTFFNADLTFDYSQVEGDVAEVQTSSLSIYQSGDHIFANSGGLPINAHITNLLGAEQLSTRGSGTLDVDLSSLHAGVYFAVVESGDERKVQRIAVVH